MRNSLSYAALAACLAMAAPALAQAPASKSKPPASAPTAATTGAPASAAPSDAPPSAAPNTEPTPPAAAGRDAAANVGASATLTTGMSVKDNTGALIGEVKALKDGVATIQMGSDTFTVDSNKLAVEGGAAKINATQAELKKMLPKK